MDCGYENVNDFLDYVQNIQNVEKPLINEVSVIKNFPSCLNSNEARNASNLLDVNDEAEKIRSGYYVNIDESLNIFKHSYNEDLLNPFAEMDGDFINQYVEYMTKTSANSGKGHSVHNLNSSEKSQNIVTGKPKVQSVNFNQGYPANNPVFSYGMKQKKSKNGFTRRSETLKKNNATSNCEFPPNNFRSYSDHQNFLRKEKSTELESLKNSSGTSTRTSPANKAPPFFGKNQNVQRENVTGNNSDLLSKKNFNQHLESIKTDSNRGYSRNNLPAFWEKNPRSLTSDFGKNRQDFLMNKNGTEFNQHLGSLENSNAASNPGNPGRNVHSFAEDFRKNRPDFLMKQGKMEFRQYKESLKNNDASFTQGYSKNYQACCCCESNQSIPAQNLVESPKDICRNEFNHHSSGNFCGDYPILSYCEMSQELQTKEFLAKKDRSGFSQHSESLKKGAATSNRGCLENYLPTLHETVQSVSTEGFMQNNFVMEEDKPEFLNMPRASTPGAGLPGFTSVYSSEFEEVLKDVAEMESVDLEAFLENTVQDCSAPQTVINFGALNSGENCQAVLDFSSFPKGKTPLSVDEIQVAETLCFMNIPEYPPFLDKDHLNVFLALEKQFREAIFYENGRVTYPILTNKHFSGMTYDISTELVNNRIISDEIFSTYVCKNLHTVDQKRVWEEASSKMFTKQMHSFPPAVSDSKKLEELKQIPQSGKSNRRFI